MVSVAGLSKDPEVKRLAEKVMNLQMFDHIIGSKEQRYQRPTLITLLRIPYLCHFGSSSFVLPIQPKYGTLQGRQ